MGNAIHKNHFRQHRHHKHRPEDIQESQISRCFYALSDGNDILKFQHLERKLDSLAEPLYLYLSDNENSMITLEQFHKRGLPLLGNSTDIYLKIFQPFEVCLQLCFDFADVQVLVADGPFIRAFVENMKRNGDTPEEIAKRKNLVCPGLLFSIQSRMFDIFLNRTPVIYDYSSDVLTPAQMYIVYGMLPETVYFLHNPFKTDDFDGKEWDLLYSSKTEKVSASDFQRKVFDYEGPTVVAIRKTNEEVFVVANDEQWKNSSRKIGGNYCILIQLVPEVKRIDGGDMLYCNFKNDSSSIMGIMFGSEIIIDGDMNDVKDIEVWGCGIPKNFSQKELDALQREAQASEQSKQAATQNGGSFLQKAAKSQGQARNEWAESADKQLLEMAGFEFDRHRNRGGPLPPQESENEDKKE